MPKDAGRRLIAAMGGVVPVAVGFLLGACHNVEDPTLKVACAVRKCECRTREPGMFRNADRVPVLWRKNGDAYCPEGFVLHSDEPPKYPPLPPT